MEEIEYSVVKNNPVGEKLMAPSKFFLSSKNRRKAEQRISSFALVSFVLSIVSIFCGAFLLSVISIIFGSVANSSSKKLFRIKNEFASAGVIISVINIIVKIILVVLVVLVVRELSLEYLIDDLSNRMFM